MMGPIKNLPTITRCVKKDRRFLGDESEEDDYQPPGNPFSDAEPGQEVQCQSPVKLKDFDQESASQVIDKATSFSDADSTICVVHKTRKH